MQLSVTLQMCAGYHTLFRPSLSVTGVYSGEKMTGVFSYESSEIDWCEDNYKHSENVVEYFNTVSTIYKELIQVLLAGESVFYV